MFAPGGKRTGLPPLHPTQPSTLSRKGRALSYESAARWHLRFYRSSMPDALGRVTFKILSPPGHPRLWRARRREHLERDNVDGVALGASHEKPGCRHAVTAMGGRTRKRIQQGDRS